MGLFDAFKKKTCSICGGDIGLLGNRKLEDGNMCKTCAKKLSPWFDERRHSTVEQINEQLAYREENKAAVEAFTATRVFGTRTLLQIDEDAGKFMVTSAKNAAKLKEENPDVVDVALVTGCELDIEEDRQELKRSVERNGETEYVSYNPPRYRYEYDFDIVIRVRHPWFDDMRFRLNDATVSLEATLSRFGGKIDPTTSAEYCQYRDMGNEICNVLLNERKASREQAAAANAPKTAVTCPWCGATTVSDANGCCEYCGGALNG